MLLEVQARLVLGCMGMLYQDEFIGSKVAYNEVIFPYCYKAMRLSIAAMKSYVLDYPSHSKRSLSRGYSCQYT